MDATDGGGRGGRVDGEARDGCGDESDAVQSIDELAQVDHTGFSIGPARGAVDVALAS